MQQQQQQEQEEEDDGKPWHPAIGLEHLLPPLPRMWSHRNPLGQVVVEHKQKFNSYNAMVCAGPNDTSNWVIPTLVLVGAYPEGKVMGVGGENISNEIRNTNMNRNLKTKKG